MDRPTLVAGATGVFGVYGVWRCDVTGVQPGTTYELSAPFRSQRVPDPRVSAGAILGWYDEAGTMLLREYAEHAAPRVQEGAAGQAGTPGEADPGTGELRRTSQAPIGAVCLRVELLFRWTTTGRVTWSWPQLRVVPPQPRRRVRVATTWVRQRYDRAENLQALLAALEQAGKAGCDIAVTSETFVDRGVLSPERLPGPITEAAARVAAAWKMYVVVGINEADGSSLYNTAVLLGRDGRVVGRYRKTHLPLVEAELGITPGSTYPVFATDFGPVGMLICWDQWFPEAARALAEEGARLICIPTIGFAPLQAAARAVDNAVVVAVSGQDGPVPSRIIGASGEVLGEIPAGPDEICIREADLADRHLRRWFSVGDADAEPGNVLRAERRTDIS